MIVVRYFGEPAAEIYDTASSTRRQVIDGVDGQSRAAFGSFSITRANDDDTATVQRIDPASGATMATIELPTGLRAWAPSAVDDDGVWYVGYRGELVHLSAATNTIDQTLNGPEANLNSIAYHDGSLWAIGKKKVTRIEPDRGTPLETIDIPTGVYASATTLDGDLWIYGTTDADSKVTVLRIDTATNRLTTTLATQSTIGGNPSPSHMTAADGYLWITTEQAALVKIDPDTNTIIKRYGENLGPASIASSPDTIWLTSGGPNANLYHLPVNEPTTPTPAR